eukprot:6179999-Pleurochrysis_carterae.AAC.2
MRQTECTSGYCLKPCTPLLAGSAARALLALLRQAPRRVGTAQRPLSRRQRPFAGAVSTEAAAAQ